MLVIYQRLRRLARELIAQHPAPLFYREQIGAFQTSALIFKTHPIIARLKTEVIPKLQANLGHGIGHATKVTLDAGALVLMEAQESGFPKNQIPRLVVMAQCAGLLHDIKRQHAHHAVKGAQKAKKVLSNYSLTPREIDQVCMAIQNHEAFQPHLPVNSPLGQLLSNCLYDADKFRWGPDNFAYTLWDMLDAKLVSVEQFRRHYPAGMERLNHISTTFRTATGRQYGPEFIEIGLKVGKRLFKEMERLKPTSKSEDQEG